ncbi:hypothetical protein [Kineococcus indalonis]|uniref:hypothetical protein n=1 Tax=Kineococcus indalonis TaxID=2696566 RepID=UPI00196B2B04|nr:hypothetical protein [Kineococcus indalonis]
MTDVGIVNARTCGTWGPGGHLPDPVFAAPSLAHAAARRGEADLSGLVAPRATPTSSPRSPPSSRTSSANSPGGAGPVGWLETTRLREGTGFGPRCDTAAADADHIAWLRAGNQR